MRMLAPALLLASLCAGCAQPAPPVIMSKKSPLELRAAQARLFDTTDRTKTVRNVIATFQDLGYNIDKVDAGSGTVSATKLATLMMSAAVSPRGERTAVRANAIVKMPGASSQVDSAEFYQKMFFAPLASAMFLEGQADTDKAAAEAPLPVPVAPASPSAKPTS